MKAVLVRHTTIALPTGTCYGRLDVPLAPTFAEEAVAVVAALPWMPTLVLTSPATRCRRLATAIATAAEPCPVLVDTRLAELHMGAWEGLRWDDISGEVFEQWKIDPWGTRPPGGENAADLLARVGEVRAGLGASRSGRVALVTHAGVIRAWRSLAEARPLPELFEDKIPFGSVWTAQ
jgi:alpha-ribazole phosphatase